MGFTPAHAGNTLVQWFRLVLVKVHPRSRGEYVHIFLAVITLLGSPPLTRGIHFSGVSFSFGQRFTPAHAGNTYEKVTIEMIQ